MTQDYPEEKVIRISDCARCPHRCSETDEYPSDYCGIAVGYRSLDFSYNRRLGKPSSWPPPSWCPLRKEDHIVKIHRRYTLA